MKEFFEALGYTGSAFIILAIVLRLFWKGDDAFKPAFKKQLTEKLTNLTIPDASPYWPSVFLDLFNKTFGDKHFSSKCIRTSLTASIGIFLVSSIFFASINFGTPQNVLHVFSVNTTVAFVSVLLVIFVNFLGDYLSLYETRIILNYVSNNKFSKKYIPLFLLLDFLLSILIFAIFFILIYSSYLLYLLLFFHEEFLEFHSRVGFSGYFQQILKSVRDDFTASMLITSLMTSIWIWIYFLGLATLRVILYFKPLLIFFKQALNIEEYPIRSIGIAATFVTATPFVLIALIQLAF